MLPNILLLLFTGIKSVEQYLWLEIPNFGSTFWIKPTFKNGLK